MSVIHAQNIETKCKRCDTNGGNVYGLKDGTQTRDAEEAKALGGWVWASVTCSICHVPHYQRNPRELL